MGCEKCKTGTNSAFCRSNGYTIFYMKQLLANFP
eukprot:SAG25_NODE_1666_length_2576_cov_3.433993_5_plen_33_part_01